MGNAKSGRYSPRDQLIEKNFSKQLIDGKLRVTCNHCSKETADNSSRQRAHLLQACKQYKKEEAAIEAISTQNTKKGQKMLSFHKANASQINEIVGMAIFAGARPFSLFDDPYLRKLVDLVGFKPPDRHTIAGPILSLCYEKIRARVLSHLDGERYLNFTFDEATNISNSRVISLSISTRRASFFYCLEEMGGEAYTSEVIVDWVYKKMEEALQELKLDWKSINSVSTDTASVMIKAWNLLIAKPELAHLFCIPCDSHGLQLLVKDLLHLPEIHIVFGRATSIVTYFKSAPKQLQVLYSIQEDLYNGKTYRLLTPVITRWGSQWTMLNALKRSQEALKEWAFRNTDGSNEIRNILLDREFWNGVDDLQPLLKPIHEAQLMSESQRSNIMIVAKRWLGIQNHLEQQLSTSMFRQDISSFLYGENETWTNRFKRQMSSLHWVAYYLHPQNASIDVPLPPALIPEIDSTINRYAGGKALKEFFYFRSKQGEFKSTLLWKDLNPLDFWIRVQQTTRSKELASFALRLYHTVANSVASERSFSAMGLQHTKIRNKLSTIQANKVVYVYMNSRVVDQLDDKENTMDSDLPDEMDIKPTIAGKAIQQDEAIEEADSQLEDDEILRAMIFQANLHLDIDDDKAESANQLAVSQQVLGKRPWEA